MKLTKTKLAVGVASATLAMAGVMAAPQAAAHSKAERVAAATDKKVEALESQVRQMNSMMKAMQAELARVKTAPSQADPRVQELDEWMASVRSKPVKEETRDNMVFFRGGWARVDHTRNGVSIQSQVAPVGAQDQADKDGFYVGAGFDFSLDDNLFGLMDNTEVLAELMFDYKEFSNNTQGNALANNPTIVAGPALDAAGGNAFGTTNIGAQPRDVTVSMFTLSASPKIKFMKGSDFRPWIIPVGLALNVISPPSESITVLNPAMMFGAGADYKVWKNIYVGADARYNLSFGDADGVDTDGFEAGGYLGIGF